MRNHNFSIIRKPSIFAEIIALKFPWNLELIQCGLRQCCCILLLYDHDLLIVVKVLISIPAASTTETRVSTGRQ